MSREMCRRRGVRMQGEPRRSTACGFVQGFAPTGEPGVVRCLAYGGGGPR